MGRYHGAVGLGLMREGQLDWGVCHHFRNLHGIIIKGVQVVQVGWPQERIVKGLKLSEDRQRQRQREREI